MKHAQTFLTTLISLWIMTGCSSLRYDWANDPTTCVPTVCPAPASGKGEFTGNGFLGLNHAEFQGSYGITEKQNISVNTYLGKFRMVEPAWTWFFYSKNSITLGSQFSAGWGMQYINDSLRKGYGLFRGDVYTKAIHVDHRFLKFSIQPFITFHGSRKTSIQAGCRLSYFDYSNMNYSIYETRQIRYTFTSLGPEVVIRNENISTDLPGFWRVDPYVTFRHRFVFIQAQFPYVLKNQTFINQYHLQRSQPLVAVGFSFTVPNNR